MSAAEALLEVLAVGNPKILQAIENAGEIMAD